MANLELTFVNAGDNGEIDVELDENRRPEQIIPELINAGFIHPIPANEQGNREYTLTVKGRGTIPEGQTLTAAGVHSGDKIRVAIAQRGGK
jgi:hypothetical protein